jgi:formylglycine-generating enzyme required for sulfatase activity
MKNTIKQTALFTALLILITGCMRTEIERINPLDPDGVNYQGTVSDLFAGVLYRDMITVPGGVFPQTNTTPSGFIHTVSGFKMAKYEVTYELWYTVYT